MLSIEQDRCRSWTDPVGVRELSSHTAGRLARKLQAVESRGDRVMFITATYDPAPYLPEGVSWDASTPAQRAAAGEACWDALNARRDVPRFIDRLGETWGVDLSGRWWAKREFTKQGQPHHHILVDLPRRFFDFSAGSAAWGLGRCEVAWAKSGRGVGIYVGKYAAKGDASCPAWLFDRLAGSLRFSTSSTGWWSEIDAAGGAAEGAHSEPAAPPDVAPSPVLSDRVRREREELHAYAAGETVGQAIARRRLQVRVRSEDGSEVVSGVTLAAARAAGVCGDDVRGHRVSHRLVDVHEGLSLRQVVRELRLVGEEFRRHLRRLAADGFTGSSAEDLAASCCSGFLSLSITQQCAPARRRKRDREGLPPPLPWSGAPVPA